MDIRLLTTTILLTLFSLASNINGDSETKENKMLLVSAGTFTMGSGNRAIDERPIHKVYLDSFYISKYEVTNSEYYKFWKSLQEKNGKPIKAKPQHTPENFTHLPHIGDWPERADKFPDYPVVGVSWHDAKAYAEWKGMRLPTEAEWEKAARGYSNNLWPWGNALKPNANTSEENDGFDNRLAPVGSYPQGKSFFGAMDMAGNVWEWTADWYSDVYYFHSPKQNPTGPTEGSWRVVRGGSWIDKLTRCGTTFRFYLYPTLKASFVGFRLAKSVEKNKK